ncbi:unnamed protein product [Taenia asiatica]|uniref:Photolyase/cryptochrome alpha/beta domain-containing protein n=1 Tax=Taenia asiatica TaxID=60517 RepID=A0A3P6NKR0_TAEAS|nr:unnamed protein product [Taenia asiatica]
MATQVASGLSSGGLEDVILSISGHISAQRCLWEVKLLYSEYKESVDAFMEEAFVRRELADNFCYYNPNYDSIKGAWSWARETLRMHANDLRKPSYSEEAMESATTGDDLWNAAQRQLLREGKMHGFLRMYWAKKILEWHAEGPEKALQLGFHLHNRYSLDGTDPNAYVGKSASLNPYRFTFLLYFSHNSGRRRS